MTKNKKMEQVNYGKIFKNIALFILTLASFSLSTITLAKESDNETKVVVEGELILNQESTLNLLVSQPKEEKNTEVSQIELELPKGIGFDKERTTELTKEQKNVAEPKLEWLEKENKLVIEYFGQSLDQALVFVPEVSGEQSLVIRNSGEKAIKNMVTVEEVTEEPENKDSDKASETEQAVEDDYENDRTDAGRALDYDYFDYVVEQFLNEGYAIADKYILDSKVTFVDESDEKNNVTLQYGNGKPNTGYTVAPKIGVISNVTGRLTTYSTNSYEGMHITTSNIALNYLSNGEAMKDPGQSKPDDEFRTHKRISLIKKNDEGDDLLAFVMVTYDLIKDKKGVTIGAKAKNAISMELSPDYFNKSILVRYTLGNPTAVPVNKGMFQATYASINGQYGVEMRSLGNLRGMYLRVPAVRSGSVITKPEVRLSFSVSKKRGDTPLQYSSNRNGHFNSSIGTSFKPSTSNGIGFEEGVGTQKIDIPNRLLVAPVANGIANTHATMVYFKTMPQIIQPYENITSAYRVGLRESLNIAEIDMDEDEYVRDEGTFSKVDISGQVYDPEGNVNKVYRYASGSDVEQDSVKDEATIVLDRNTKTGEFKFSVPAEELAPGTNIVNMKLTSGGRTIMVKTAIIVRKKVKINYVSESGSPIKKPSGYEGEFFEQIGTRFSKSVPTEIGDYTFERIEADTPVSKTGVSGKNTVIGGMTSGRLFDINVVYKTEKVEMKVEYLQKIGTKETDIAVIDDINNIDYTKPLERKQATILKDVLVGEKISTHLTGIDPTVVGYKLVPGYKVVTGSGTPV